MSLDLVRKAVQDPGFYNLTPSDRKAVLLSLDPDNFGAMSSEEQDQTVSGITNQYALERTSTATGSQGMALWAYHGSIQDKSSSTVGIASDSDMAARAQADYLKSNISSVVKPVPALAAAQVAQGIGGKVRQAGDVLDLQGLSDWGQNLAAQGRLVEGQVQTEEPLKQGTWANSIRGALTSIYQQAPGMVTGGALMANGLKVAGAAASLAPMGAVTGGAAYDKYRERGFDVGTASLGSGIEEVVEVSTELLPTLTMLKTVIPGSKQMLKQFVGGLIRYGAEEYAGETLATLGQDVTDKFLSNPNLTDDQKRQQVKNYFTKINPETGNVEAWDNFLETMRSTTAQMLLMGGAGSVARGVLGDGQQAFQPQDNRVLVEDATQSMPAPSGPLSKAVNLSEIPATITPALSIQEQGAAYEAEQNPYAANLQKNYRPVDNSVALLNQSPTVDIAAGRAVTGNELMIDEARAWASKTPGMQRMVGEGATAHLQRVMDAFKRNQNQSAAVPVVQETPVEPMSLELLKGGDSPVLETTVKPVVQADPVDKLSLLTDDDRQVLARERDVASAWERGSWENGRSNKTQLFPWLSDWGKTTPLEISAAIDNLLTGKRLGDVQRQLVIEALKGGRERIAGNQVEPEAVPFEFKPADATVKWKSIREGIADRGGMKVTEVNALAEEAAKIHRINLDGSTLQQRTELVKQYKAWKEQQAITGILITGISRNSTSAEDTGKPVSVDQQLNDLPEYAQRAIMEASMERRTNKGGSIDAPDPFANSTWRTESVSLDTLKPTPSTFQHRGSVTKGPIVVAAEGEIIDGNNRLYEARQRGDESIQVYREIPGVPVDQQPPVNVGKSHIIKTETVQSLSLPAINQKIKGSGFKLSAKQQDGSFSLLNSKGDTVHSFASLDEAQAKAESVVAEKKGGLQDLSSKKSEKAKTSTVTDAGEELKANKRNKVSGLKFSEIQNENDAFKVNMVKKEKVYPKPDYQALVDGGMQPLIAHVLKQVYDSLAVAPATKGNPTNDDFRLYIDALNRVMERTLAWANDTEAIRSFAGSNARTAGAMLGKVTDLSSLVEKPGMSMLDFIYPEGWRSYRPEVTILGGNKALQGMQPGYDEIKRAIKDIDKGWPGKVEAWQKQGWRIIGKEGFKVEEVKQVGDRGSIFYVRKQLGERSYNYIDAGYFNDRGEAQAFIEGLQDNLLFNKRSRLDGHYATLEEAREAARFKTRKEGTSSIDERGVNVADAERVGPEYRTGDEKVTSEKLKETFAFRGVNFGNWVPQDERQLHLNHAYDSFMDLAQILDVPPKALSLNGMLGLAIGAQGSGSALAHFVPGYNEINITRTAGAGAVAHEFAHALDHYFANQAGLGASTSPWVTVHKTQGANGTARPEIVKAIADIVHAMERRQETPEETIKREETMLAREKARLERWLEHFAKKFAADPVATSRFTVLADRMRAGEYGTGEDAYVSISKGSGRNLGTSVVSIVADVRELAKSLTDKPGIDDYKALHGVLTFLKHLETKQGEGHVPQSVTTRYSKDAQALDKDKKKKYWSTPLEMFARAFDSYVSDKLAEQSHRNDYLSHTGRESETTPRGEERQTINRAFDVLIAEIQTRETNKGIELYSNPMFNPQLIVKELTGLAQNLEAEIRQLVNLGQRVIHEGATGYSTFVGAMKKYLGEKWQDFRRFMIGVYAKARAAYESSPLGNERGSIGDRPTVIEVDTAIENITSPDTFKRLRSFLNLLDWSWSRKNLESRLSPEQKHAVGWLLQTPLWKQSEDPAARPFYREGQIREENRLTNNIRMLGGLVQDASKPDNLKQKFKDFFSWDDLRTQWEETKRQTYYKMSRDERLAYDVMRFEGDAHNVEYTTLANALRNPRIKAAGVDEKVFSFYKKALAAEDVAFEEKLAIARENMELAEVSPEDIEGHIAKHRADYKDIRGWVHRDHGDGEYVVTVHHTIDRLDWLTDNVKVSDGSPAFRVRLGYYPGLALVRKMQKITGELGGTFKQLENGELIMLFRQQEQERAMRKLNGIELVNDKGDPYRVMVYARYVQTEKAAANQIKEVKTDLGKAMPVNYREGHRYTVRSRHSTSIREDEFQDLKMSDMSLERIMSHSIDRMANRGELPEEHVDTIREALGLGIAESLLGRGAGLYQIRRASYLIEGYDRTDAVGKFESYVHGVAGMLSKARYALAQYQNLKNAPIEIRRWATSYIHDGLRNMGRADQISGDARALISLWYLGFNATWMLVNHTQPYTFGQAELSKFTKGPMRRIVKAEKDILLKKLSKKEQALWDDPRVKVQIEETALAEMAGSDAGIGGWLSKGIHATAGVAMAHGHKVEVLNRKTIILAAYRAFLEQGLDAGEALGRALKVNSKVNIDMGRYNLPGFASGSATGRGLYALQSFIQHALQYLYYNGTSGKKEDQRALFRLLLVMYLIGGLPAGIPGADELDKTIRFFFGYSPKFALRGFLKRYLKDYGSLGEALDGFIWHGVPGALKPLGMGVSLTGAIQFRIPVISSLINGDDASKAFGGAVGGLISKFGSAYTQAKRGDYWKATEQALPTSAGNVMSGIRQSHEKVTTSHGAIVKYKGKPVQMTPTEGIIKAVGMQPAHMADLQEARSVERWLESEWGNKRSLAIDNYRNGDRTAIRRFNDALKSSQAAGLVHPISDKTIRNGMDRTNKDKIQWQRKNGLD